MHLDFSTGELQDHHPEKTRIYRNPNIQDIELKSGRGNRAERMHAHIQWSLSYVRSGAAQVTCGIRTNRLEAGQWISIPPGVPHLCNPEPEGPFAFSVVYLGNPITYNLASSLRDRCVIGALPVEAFDSFASSLLELSDAGGLSESISKLGEGEQVLLTEVECHESHLSFCKASEKTGLDYAQGARLSRYQTYRRLHRRHGAGKKTIETIQAVEMAKTLLATGDSLADTAVACGFYDQSHFTRTFKLYTGLTPNQYRPG